MKKMIGFGLVALLAVSFVFLVVKKRRAQRLECLDAEMSEAC